MFLAGEQNCTAQRPLVTQIKGDSAEGERVVRVFLLSETWGRCVVFVLPLPPPWQVQLTWAGVKSFEELSQGLWWMRSLSHCWLCCSHSSPLCSVVLQDPQGSSGALTEPWFAEWVKVHWEDLISACILWSPRCDCSLASHSTSGTSALFHIKFHPCMLPKTFLEAQWHFSIKVREWIYSFLQQTQKTQIISCSVSNKIMILKDISFSRLLHLACL